MTDLPARYRKRPIPVEARQLTDDADWTVIALWCGAVPHAHTPGDLKDQLAIPTLEGVLWANVGDWIVKGPGGECWPVRGSIFAETYEPADAVPETGPAALLLQAVDNLTAAISRCPTTKGHCLSCEAKAAAVRELRRMLDEIVAVPSADPASMSEARQVGPRCGNNPNVTLTPGDRKAVDDFKARLALQKDAQPYIERAAWVDFDPLMEVIASTIWKHCARDDQEQPQAVCDDPRTIAAFAAAVARAETEQLREKHKANIRHADQINNELMEEIQRYAAGTERPVLWSVYNRMHLRADNAEAAVERARAIQFRTSAPDSNALGLAQDNGWNAALHWVRKALDGPLVEQPEARSNDKQDDEKCACGHGRPAHNSAGCIECPGGWRAGHKFVAAVTAHQGGEKQ